MYQYLICYYFIIKVFDSFVQFGVFFREVFSLDEEILGGFEWFFFLGKQVYGEGYIGYVFGFFDNIIIRFFLFVSFCIYF